MSIASMLEMEEKFPSTLARQLAIFNGDFKVSLVKRLREPNSEMVLSLPLEKQMRTLILEPMNGLKGILSASEKRFTIILDGLDECGDSETLGTLMNLVLALDELPSAFSILGFVIPCEDMDKVARDETFDTIRLMVTDGLKDCIRKSQWKPLMDDLDAFTLACRGLPVMASIRIREVRFRTQGGSVLKLEFRYFLDLQDAPKDLNEEYLRIMRRAFRPNMASIPSHVVNNYRQVVGMVVVAHDPLSVYSMSRLLGIAEDEIYAILNPIGSIIDIPSNNMNVKFYHATAKEFITGDPIGEE
ncbi:uncharacterized protein EI90DRAFT_3042109, partial [Cantharellus anzutake]|uniref:uncharacterized protein n=1 Tax=Cantharellus anzutake TaxID=1750568 RepID=UPI001905A06B